MQVGISKTQIEETIKTLDERIAQGITFFRDYVLFLTEAWKEGRTSLEFCSYYPDLLETFIKQKEQLEALKKWDSIYLSEEKACILLNVFEVANPTQIDDGLLDWMEEVSKRIPSQAEPKAEDTGPEKSE